MTNRFNLYQTAKLALVAGLMTLAPSLVSAEPECSASTLNGAYAYGASGLNTAPGPPGVVTPSPSNQVGIVTFDGAGKFKIILTSVSAYGVTPLFIPFSGTYTVNPDCSGTLTLKFSDTNSSHSAIVIGGAATTIYAIIIDAPLGNTNSLTFTKIQRNLR